MKKPVYACFLIVLFSSALNAQTIITGTVKDSLNQPIPFANVYLVKTTIGTVTDAEGKYLLKIPQHGRYQLFATCVGYNSNGVDITTDGRSQNIDIKLKLNYFRINEVTIRASDHYKKRYYNFFVRQFIGQTSNSMRCKIANPEDLHLYKNKETDILNGFSIKPLRIVNKALGYTIIYDLIVFKYDPASGMVQFAGNPFFESFTGNKRKMKMWENNRLKAYYGSRMHFIRALFADSLSKENYEIFETDTANKNDTELKVENIVTFPDSIYKKLFNQKPIKIFYRIDPEIDEGSIISVSERYKSSMIFSDSIKIYRNGMFENPFSVVWDGLMSIERMGDMLPFDYQPAIMNKSEIDSSLRINDYKYRKDQVFVHTDRNRYCPADTIYFQAYIRDKNTEEFKSGSVSLYTMLFNEEKEMSDSARFRIENAASSGWMTIPKNAKPGKYRFVAFTGMMQNDDPKDAFLLDLKVDTFPGNPELHGEIEKNIDKVPLTKNSDFIKNEQFIDLKFLPEGGTFIEGLQQNIGFNATDNQGEPVYIEGLLKRPKGEIIDTIKSGLYGPGLFSCKAETGMYVELINGIYQKKIWPLPESSSNGISMNVKQVNKKSFSFEIQSDKYANKKIIVRGSMEGTSIFENEGKLDRKKRILINTDELPTGVAQICLFDSAMNQISERLVYINADEQLKINISADTTVYNPGQETELSISLTNEQGFPERGKFSISVVNAASAYDTELFIPGIEHTFNYKPYFLLNLPSKARLKGLENLTDEERDLLLMIYSKIKNHPDENSLDSIGKEIINYELMKIKLLFAKKSLSISRKFDLVSREKLFIRQILADKNGEFFLPLDSLDNVIRTVVLMTDTTFRSRIKGTELTIPGNNKYFKSDDLLQSLQKVKQNRFNLASLSDRMLEADSIPGISKVSLTNQLNIDYGDKIDDIKPKPIIPVLRNEQIWSCLTFEEALFKLATPYAVEEDYIYLLPPGSTGQEAIASRFLIDCDLRSWPWVKSIIPWYLESITFLNNTEGFRWFNMDVRGGVVFITKQYGLSILKLAKKYYNWQKIYRYDKSLVPVSIYRPSIRYFNPDKAELISNSQLQNRPTLFWKPDVYFDGQNPVKIKIPNQNQEGTVIITINGISENNLSGTGKAYYKIQKNIPKKNQIN